MTSRLGLFGGTFNPVHHGHLVSVQEASRSLGLDRVLFLPTGHPPHRAVPEVSPVHRMNMTRRALDRSDFETSSFELSNDGPNYSINTVTHFRDRRPDSTSLYYLTGADELIEFTSWHRWQDILDRVQVVGMNRPGFDLDRVPDEVAAKATFVDIPNIDISSSEIRDRIRSGEPARFFVPAEVWRYIRTHNLYR